MALQYCRLRITGMSCVHCQKAVEEALKEAGGVEKAVVSLEEGIAEITFDPERITLEEVKKKVAEAGYTAE